MIYDIIDDQATVIRALSREDETQLCLDAFERLTAYSEMLESQNGCLEDFINETQTSLDELAELPILDRTKVFRNLITELQNDLNSCRQHSCVGENYGLLETGNGTAIEPAIKMMESLIDEPLDGETLQELRSLKEVDINIVANDDEELKSVDQMYADLFKRIGRRG